MGKIYLVDVTNRDGVQTSRLGLAKLEKTVLNILLNNMGVHQCEFGFPNTLHETNYINAAGKVRLTGGRDRGYGIAASGYASLNKLKADPLVSSGEDNFGAEFNVSFFGEWASLHLSTGTKLEDVRDFPTGTFTYAKQKYLTAALEMTPRPDVSFSLEWIGGKIYEKNYIVGLNEEYQVAMISLKYSANQFTFSTGAAMHMPEKEAGIVLDHYKYLAGVTYGYDKPKKAPKPVAKPSTSPMTAPFNSISKELDALRGEIEDIKNNKSKLTEEEAIAQPMVQPLAPVEVEVEAALEPVIIEVAAERKDNPYEYLRVEVINVSGIKGLGDAVADLLKKDGFNVVKVASLSVSNKKKSFILHKKEFVNEGVMVAREIPKDQDVLISKRLSSKVDVRVVVGRDLKFILKK